MKMEIQVVGEVEHFVHLMVNYLIGCGFPETRYTCIASLFYFGANPYNPYKPRKLGLLSLPNGYKLFVLNIV